MGDQARAYRARIHAEVLAHYGDRCACCGTTEDLSIDHVNGDGAAHTEEVFGSKRIRGYRFYLWLRKNDYPPGYQVLCRPCNHSKAGTNRCWLNHGQFPADMKLCNHSRHEGPNPLPVSEFYLMGKRRNPKCKSCWRRDDPVRRPRKGTPPGRRGDSHPGAVMTAEIVLSCRRRVRDGETQTALAREYGVTVATMNDAVHGRTWAWLQDEEVVQ